MGELTEFIKKQNNIEIWYNNFAKNKAKLKDKEQAYKIAYMKKKGLI